MNNSIDEIFNCFNNIVRLKAQKMFTCNLNLTDLIYENDLGKSYQKRENIRASVDITFIQVFLIFTSLLYGCYHNMNFY